MNALPVEVLSIVLTCLPATDIVRRPKRSVGTRAPCLLPGPILVMSARLYALAQDPIFWEWVCTTRRPDLRAVPTFSIDVFGRCFLHCRWTRTKRNKSIKEVHSELTEDVSTGTTTIIRDNGVDWSFYVTEPLISDVSVTIVALGDTNLNKQYFTVGVTTCTDWGTHFRDMELESVYFHTQWEDVVVQKVSSTFQGIFHPSCANQMTVTVDHNTQSLIALDGTGSEIHRTSFICLGSPNEKDVRLFVGLGSVMSISLI